MDVPARVGTVRGMSVVKALGRVARFTVKAVVAVVTMGLVAVAQGLAVVWYVTAATPECGGELDRGLYGASQVGLVGLGAASAVLAMVLGVWWLRLRWGWLLWWLVPVAALCGPALTLYLLPSLSPGVGGLFCH